MNSMKRQKDMTPEVESSGSKGVQYATGEEWRTVNKSARNEATRPSGNDTQWWTCPEVKVKSDAMEENIAQQPGMLGP